jgi:hypothetical protein
MPSKKQPVSSADDSKRRLSSAKRAARKKPSTASKQASKNSSTVSPPRPRRKRQSGSVRRQKAQSEGFRSAFEHDIAKSLDARGIAWEYETVEIEWLPKAKKYVPDFILSNGVIVECKGKFDADDRAKHLAVREQHPEYDIRLLFQNAHNKLRKGAKMTYAEWCDKHGIEWAHKHLPREWTK